MTRAAQEAFVREFHARWPGATACALARGDVGDGRSSYAVLAEVATDTMRVLDLGCGDGALLDHVASPRVVGVDLSMHELAVHKHAGVQARAQQLPFGNQSFDAVLSHLAFTLMPDLDEVADEIARVLTPGGVFAAIVGGGPVHYASAARPDGFSRFLELAAPYFATTNLPRLGDVRARHDAGWRELFEPRGFVVEPLQRIEIDLGGTAEDVWTSMSLSYGMNMISQAHFSTLRSAFIADVAAIVDDHGFVPCRMVVWLGTAVRRMKF